MELNSIECETLEQRLNNLRKERRRKSHETARKRKCKVCGIETTNSNFCADTCRSEWVSARLDTSAYPRIGNLAKGAASEMAVMADLLRRGYEVFCAVSPGALFDIVAVDKDSTEKIIRIQVRSGYITSDGRIRPSNRAKSPTYDVLACSSVEGVSYYPDLPPSQAGTSRN